MQGYKPLLKSCLFFESNSITVNNILLRGDSMHRNAFENGLIPRERYLSINELPTVVPWSMHNFQVQIQLSDNEAYKYGLIRDNYSPMRHKYSAMRLKYGPNSVVQC